MAVTKRRASWLSLLLAGFLGAVLATRTGPGRGKVSPE